MRGTIALTLIGLIAMAGADVQAQAPAAAPAQGAAQTVDPRAVVQRVREVIAQRYVLPERRPALDAVLAEGLSSGRYAVTDPNVLAERINADLERVGRDKHLGFSYNPQQAALIRAAFNQAQPDRTAYERQVRSGNHGIHELKLLPGNVRYMDYRGFAWMGDETRTALDAAMQFLSGGDAVIIDLRRNGGGSPAAVQHIISHFMEADRPLVTFHMNGEPEPNSLSSLRDLKAPRMVGKPLYVLTSGASASAAEEFAGHVGGYRLGELVGANTAGAGFRNDTVAIDGGFVLSVSVGRAVLASTGKDWEAVGHAPTIPVPVPAALDTAHAHALRRLAATAPQEDRARFAALADILAARQEGRSAALPLNSYAGIFGERTVSLERDRLFYQRADSPREALIPIGGNNFVFDSNPATTVEFVPGANGASAIVIASAGGPAQGRYERTR